MAHIRNIASTILHDERRTWWHFPLAALSFLYGGVMRLRNLLYDRGIRRSYRLPCKVISVGNITVGGTGKTPLIIMLARMLREEGYRPAVLCRGYRGESRSPVNVVSDGTALLMTPRDAGDEPVLIARNLGHIPVITGRKRYLTGRQAIEEFGADLLLLDDAFQHRRVRRDIDILLLDSVKPFGNGFMLPRGILREPVTSMKRATLIVETGSRKEGTTPPAQFLRTGHHPPQPLYRGHHAPRDLVKGTSGESLPLDRIRGKSLCLFSGIAEPERFRTTVASLGGEILEYVTFPDHHSFTEADLARVRDTARTCGAGMIVTTEKDGIKLFDFPDSVKDIYILRIEMEILPSRGTLRATVLEQITR